MFYSMGSIEGQNNTCSEEVLNKYLLVVFNMWMSIILEPTTT